MNCQKNTINKKEYFLILVFFILSLLFGKLAFLNNIKGSELLNSMTLGVRWGFYILLILVTIYGFYKLYKKEYTIEKLWLWSGIFIWIQFAGVFQFEIRFRFFDMSLNNVLFHDMMISRVFSIAYFVFLLYYFVMNKEGKTKNGLREKDVLILLFFVLWLLLRDVLLYCYHDIMEGVQSKNMTFISGIIFSEGMNYNEKATIAEKYLDNIMLLSKYVGRIYGYLIYIAICVGGVTLLKEKIDVSKYFALGGTFLLIQYLGITYTEKMLNCLNNSFYSSNSTLFYDLVLRYSYTVIFLIPLFLYFLKKVYERFVKRHDS